MRASSRFQVYALLLGLWTAISLAYASHLYFYHALREGESSWSSALVESFADWYVWGLLSIPVLSLARRFPLRSIRNIALHLFLSLFFSALQVAIHSLIDQLWIHQTFSSDTVATTFRLFFARTYHFGLLVYGLIVVARDALERYKNQQVNASQLEARLAEAQLQALRSRLQPHFLFNTLNTIASLMHQDVQSADRMIIRLSELLRLTLASNVEQEIPLKQELEFLAKYIEIEQERFRDRLKVRMEVEPEVLDAAVPSFLLQPIVENSIRHGMAASRDGGLIEIRAGRKNGLLHLQVIDNGKGIADQEVREGIGLSHTRMRLEQIYGNRFEFHLKPGRERGTDVQITIPFLEKRK